MGEPLKRTFHGCLTCRKRKVRCRGGDPCQNCSRMNITCHSSFDTNLRIRVSTSTGQKDVGAKPKPAREPKVKTQSPMPPSPASLVDFDGRTKPFPAGIQGQFNTFHLTSPTPVFTPEPQSIPQINSMPSSYAVVPDLDPIHFPGGWGFDFALDPSLEHRFHIPTDISVAHPMGVSSVTYAPFTPPSPLSHQSYPRSDSEGSMSSTSQPQSLDMTREWVPRRRKRPKKADSKSETSVKGGSDNTSHLQENTTTPGYDPWTLERFALDTAQKCPSHCPFRQSVMAWRSRESAADPTIPNPTAEAWYAQSSDQVDRLMTLSDSTVQLSNQPQASNAGEILICAAFFLNRYDVLAGDVDAADSRLDRMTRWLAEHPGDLQLSGFASKLLLWSSYLHIRLNMFGGSYPRFNLLLDVLVDRPDHHQIVEKSHNFLWDMFDGHQDLPQELLADEVERIPISLRLHDMFCLLDSMLHYRSAQHSQLAARDPSSWDEHIAARHAAIEGAMQRMEGEFHMAEVMNPSASVLRRGALGGGLDILAYRRFGSGGSTPPEGGGDSATAASELSIVNAQWLTAYASFLTTKIMWSRVTRPDIRTEPASASAAETILQIALLLRRGRGYANLLQGCSLVLWPIPLFVAGIETVDEVRSDWVRLFMSMLEGGGVRPGSGSEVLDLMEEVRRRQVETGRRVFVDETMLETGRVRGIFAFRG